MKFRQQYADPKGDEELGKDSAILCLPEEDMTLQGPADECDINVMMRKFGVTGMLPVVDRKPFFGDFTGVVDFQTALNAVREAEREFAKLPSEVRKAIDNDPGRVGEWLSDPANTQKAMDMGLIERPEVVQPIPVRMIADEAPT